MQVAWHLYSDTLIIAKISEDNPKVVCTVVVNYGFGAEAYNFLQKDSQWTCLVQANIFKIFLPCGHLGSPTK